jgi:hypothetical protein
MKRTKTISVEDATKKLLQHAEEVTWKERYVAEKMLSDNKDEQLFAKTKEANRLFTLLNQERESYNKLNTQYNIVVNKHNGLQKRIDEYELKNIKKRKIVIILLKRVFGDLVQYGAKVLTRVRGV